jgi:hypothetical protein
MARLIWTINKNPEARFVQNATIDLNIAVIITLFLVWE